MRVSTRRILKMGHLGYTQNRPEKNYSTNFRVQPHFCRTSIDRWTDERRDRRTGKTHNGAYYDCRITVDVNVLNLVFLEDTGTTAVPLKDFYTHVENEHVARL